MKWTSRTPRAPTRRVRVEILANVSNPGGFGRVRVEPGRNMFSMSLADKSVKRLEDLGEGHEKNDIHTGFKKSN